MIACRVIRLSAAACLLLWFALPNAHAAKRYVVQYGDVTSANSALSDGIAALKPRLQVNAQALRAKAAMVRRVPQIEYLSPLGGDAHLIRLPDDATALANLKATPNVLSVEEDRLQKIAFVPNDTLWSPQWYLQPRSSRQGSDFETAWDRSTGVGQIIAVVDTGVVSHRDLGSLPLVSGDSQRPTTPVSGKLIAAGYDFISDCRLAGTCDLSRTTQIARSPQPNAFDLGDAVSASAIASIPFSSDLFNNCDVTSEHSWHGTHVAGISAASSNNSQGISGAAPAAQIFPLRVLGRCGGFASDTQRAIRWAAGIDVGGGLPINPNPAHVINLSLATACPIGEVCECPASYQAAITEVIARGTTVVVAAGNETTDVRNIVPANCQGVIVAGASNRQGQLASYSNTGAAITLLAPGGELSGNDERCTSPLSNYEAICSLANGGLTSFVSNDDVYSLKNGTSMSAPLISAAVALVRQQNPNLSPAGIKAVLQNSAHPIDSLHAATRLCLTNGRCGSGMLDVPQALTLALGSVLIAEPSGLTFKLSSGTQTQTLQLRHLPSPANNSVIQNLQLIIGQSNFSVTRNTCTTSSTLAPNAVCELDITYQYLQDSDSTTLTVLYDNERNSANRLIIPLANSLATVPSSLSNSSSSSSGGFGCTPLLRNSVGLIQSTDSGQQESTNSDNAKLNRWDLSLLLLLLFITLWRFRPRIQRHSDILMH